MFRAPLAALAFAAMLCAGPASAQQVTEYLGMPKTIAVDGTTYTLAWSSRPNASYTKQEYLPEGAEPETYGSMVLVEFLAGEQPVSDVVAAQVAMIQQRKGSDPVANVAVMQNAEKGEILLDFLLSTKDANGEFIVEWNGYRYVAGLHDGKPGTLLFAVSERAYGNEASKTFLSGLKTFKTERIRALTTAEMPQPR